ncbi:MAG: hypothetical protein AB7S26_01230 [Sandaracinaceae bacterium]
MDRFKEPARGSRDWYAYEAIRTLPAIIQLVDKNRYSKTYGCFDREYWHYRTVDFPCGMSQEMCLPLALAYAHDFGGQNPYAGNARLRDLAIAGIEFAGKITHPDGSTDDYFPFERALGAHVFSTYAMTEAYQVLGLDRPDLVDLFRLRGDWLIANNESGQLANHQAFAALALWNVYEITGEAKYKERSDHFRDICLSWQHAEGWFQEYEGSDPGYHSCSIAFLGRLYAKSRDEKLVEPLSRAVEYATYFLHPDGSYAGEYGSRNTYHFYAYGFEVMARHTPWAGRIAQTVLEKMLPDRRRYHNEDNRMISHCVIDWMQAWIAYDAEHRDGLVHDHRGPFTRWFDDARLFVKKTDRYYAVVSLAKGGVIKVFDESGPLYSDTGLIARTAGGDVLVSHMVDDYELEVDERSGTLRARGEMKKRRHQLSDPLKQIAFRGMNLTLGRLNPHLVRSTLQKVLITGKPRSDARFARTIELGDEGVVIHDRIDISGSDLSLESLACGSDATSIYVANSNVFQESVLCPWIELDEHVEAVNAQRLVDLPPRRVV